jgi:hypothetical protein
MCSITFSLRRRGGCTLCRSTCFLETLVNSVDAHRPLVERTALHDFPFHIGLQTVFQAKFSFDFALNDREWL